MSPREHAEAVQAGELRSLDKLAGRLPPLSHRMRRCDSGSAGHQPETQRTVRFAIRALSAGRLDDSGASDPGRRRTPDGEDTEQTVCPAKRAGQLVSAR